MYAVWAARPCPRAAVAGLVLGAQCKRACCEELAYNLLYCWFLGMDLPERSFDGTAFTKNR